MIERLSVSNFKSFEKLDVSLGNLNVLIGTNASGKTNFIRLLRFLKDISIYSLKDAIYKQGGAKYFLNLTLGTAQPFSVSFGFKPSFLPVDLDAFNDKEAQVHSHHFLTDHAEYNFALRFNDSEIAVVSDTLTLNGKINITVPPEEPCLLVFSKINNFITRDSPTHPEFSKDIGYLVRPDIAQQMLLIQIDIFCRLFEVNGSISSLEREFFDIGFHDFEPKRIKQTVQSLGNGTLTESGDNFAAILERILSDDEKQREYLNLVSYALPFISELSITKNLLGQLSFTLRETHQSDVLPSELLSEGTLNVLALVAVLYFSNYNVVVIEEPERHIHPALLAGVMELVKEASEKKQIILTTHHPEIVRHAGIENLLLVSRNEKGFSEVSRPADSEDVKRFLQNELGIDYLYVQQLL